MKSNFVNFVLSMFFPDRCPYCKKVIRYGMTECEDCLEELYGTPRKIVTFAGIPCIAPFAYQAKVRDSLIDFKFRGNAFNAKSYAKAVCHAVEYYGLHDEFDIITFVPLSQKRKNERGFDQSELTAQYIGELLDKKVKVLLQKTRQNKNQHDLNLSERILNVKGVYAAVNTELIKNRNILLIDDIATTGNTLAECCRILKENGAGNIICAAIAISGAV